MIIGTALSTAALKIPAGADMYKVRKALLVFTPQKHHRSCDMSFVKLVELRRIVDKDGRLRL